MLYNFMYLTCNLLYIMLICIKLHIEYMLFHIGIEMEPFRRDDDEDFLHNIIREGFEHQIQRDDAEYDGCEFLNDTGDGDADQTEKWLCKTLASRYMEFVLIQLHRLCM